MIRWLREAAGRFPLSAADRRLIHECLCDWRHEAAAAAPAGLKCWRHFQWTAAMAMVGATMVAGEARREAAGRTFAAWWMLVLAMAACAALPPFVGGWRSWDDAPFSVALFAFWLAPVATYLALRLESDRRHTPVLGFGVLSVAVSATIARGVLPMLWSAAHPDVPRDIVPWAGLWVPVLANGGMALLADGVRARRGYVWTVAAPVLPFVVVIVTGAVARPMHLLPFVPAPLVLAATTMATWFWLTQNRPLHATSRVVPR